MTDTKLIAYYNKLLGKIDDPNIDLVIADIHTGAGYIKRSDTDNVFIRWNNYEDGCRILEELIRVAGIANM